MGLGTRQHAAPELDAPQLL